MRRDDRPPAPSSALRRLRVAAGSTLGGWIIRLLGMTWRVRRVNAGSFDAMRARKEPFIAVFWHGEILPVTWAHRGQGFAALISRHDDGEMIARVVEGLGLNTLRGSTTRGGVRALLEAAQLLGNGVSLAITPDGPRGPRHVFAPGALMVAQRAGRPIVLVAATASRAWRAKSWDRHLVPKPFSTVTVTYSEPLFVAAGNAREAEQETPRFETLLGALVDRT